MKLKHDFEPLPPYVDPRQLLRGLTPSLRPARRVSVVDAAEESMMVNEAGHWKKFDRSVTPYMIEPAQSTLSRLYNSVVFCGPSQSGKTEMLKAVIAYAITSDHSRVALFQMTRDAARDFVQNKLDPMIRNSPDLARRRSMGRGSDTQYQKLFRGPTELSINWPVISQLSSASIRFVLMTDYDHFPMSIDGEGDGYTLAKARTRSFRSRGMVVCESSPGAPITNEAWRPASPHDSPPVKYGVLALYPQGTRARWYWPCPHCEDKFEPRFSRLKYPKTLDPAEAGEQAEMACPHCGGLIGHHYKRELNAAGCWLHESANGDLVTLESGKARRTDMLSYWLDGAAAAFSTWAELVEQQENALRKFEATGDEQQLISAANTGQAQPYLPRAQRDDNEVTLQALKDKITEDDATTPKGVAPVWARYILVTVDTQATRFVVGVTAMGHGGRRQLIDRYDLITPPGDDEASEDRALDPFNRAEDWRVLEGLEGHYYPVEGQSYGLRPLVAAVDMQGGGATSENAYRFFRQRRKAGFGRFWYLSRGRGGHHRDRVWLEAPERASAKKGRKVAKDIEIMNMSTDRLKDAATASLMLPGTEHNATILPVWLEEPYLIEFTAERRTAKGWRKKPGMVRNESLDHAVQVQALHIVIGGEKIDADHPPAWATGGPENSMAVDMGAERTGDTVHPAPVVRKRRTSTMRL